jgi:predicted O-methyltransferase YrrM
VRHWRSKLRLLAHGLRYREIFGYLEIDGWLRVEEARTLYDLARGLPDRPVVVEIGSWQGKSSLVLGSALRHKRAAELHCIDPFNADGDDASRDNYSERATRLGGTLLDRFRANMAAADLLQIVRPRPGYSHDLVGEFRAPLDMVFIDGDHAYEAVLRDYRDWSPLLRPGGVLAFHDVGRSATPGPARVIDEFVKGDPQWIDQRQVRSLYHCRRAAARGSNG